MTRRTPLRDIERARLRQSDPRQRLRAAAEQHLEEHPDATFADVGDAIGMSAADTVALLRGNLAGPRSWIDHDETVQEEADRIMDCDP